MSIEDRIAHLEAREKIEETTLNYIHGLDKGNKERFLKAWTDDAKYIIGGAWGAHEGKEAISAAFDGFQLAFYELHHFATNLAIEGPDGDTATSISDVLVTTTDSLGTAGISAATYYDKYRREGDAWPFYERAITIHYHVPMLEPQGLDEDTRIYLTEELGARLVEAGQKRQAAA